MDKIVCPVCGTPTSLNLVIIEDERAYLPDSSTDTRSIFGKASVNALKYFEHPENITYGILECQACGKHFIGKQHDYDDTDWVAIYPIPYKPVSEEIPQPIKSEFEEANLCFAVGAYKACASMCQIALEALW